MPIVDLTVIFDGIQDRKFRLKTGQHIGQSINPTVSSMGKTSLSNRMKHAVRTLPRF